MEQEIVRFMDRNLWWKRMGIGTPEVLPKELSKIGFLVDYNSSWSVTDRLQGIVVYHFLMGKLIGLFTRDNIVIAYYAGRILSFLLFMGSLYIIYLTFLKFGTGKKGKVLPLSYGFLFIFIKHSILFCCLLSDFRAWKTPLLPSSSPFGWGRFSDGQVDFFSHPSDLAHSPFYD